MNGDWICELAFGGGIFRVIFGRGALCRLFGDAGLANIEVGLFGDAGFAIIDVGVLMVLLGEAIAVVARFSKTLVEPAIEINFPNFNMNDQERSTWSSWRPNGAVD